MKPDDARAVAVELEVSGRLAGRHGAGVAARAGRMAVTGVRWRAWTGIGLGRVATCSAGGTVAGSRLVTAAVAGTGRSRPAVGWLSRLTVCGLPICGLPICGLAVCRLPIGGLAVRGLAVRRGTGLVARLSISARRRVGSGRRRGIVRRSPLVG